MDTFPLGKTGLDHGLTNKTRDSTSKTIGFKRQKHGKKLGR